jgi:hypothetical protein
VITQEKALDEQSVPRAYPCCGRTCNGPQHHDRGENMLNLESLQYKRHRVQAGQHAEIEQRRGPAEPGSVLGRGSRRMIHHQELEVGRHAEQGGTSQNGL